MNRRLGAILVVGVLPWSVLLVPDGVGRSVSLVFAWGLVTPEPFHLVTVTTYLFELTRGLPGWLLAWPIGSLCYGLALAGAVSGDHGGPEDRRVTAALLVIAGASHLTFADGTMARSPGSLVLPVGTLACWLVAGWFHWPAVRRDVGR